MSVVKQMSQPFSGSPPFIFHPRCSVGVVALPLPGGGGFIKHYGRNPGAFHVPGPAISTF